jgi:PleD family two-component response regulator
VSKRKRQSGSMHLEHEDPAAKPKSGMTIRRGTIQKLLVVDPDAARCTRIARALPSRHVVLVANDPTMALALCIREKPTLVVAVADLVTMNLSHFIALVEYATRTAPPPFVAIGMPTSTNPRILTTIPNADTDEVRRVVTELLGDSPDDEQQEDG